MNSRDDPEKTYKVALPDNNSAMVYLRDAMSVEEFLASACARKNLNPMEHFVRVKKRRDMEDHNYFVPHRNDLIETYVCVQIETFTAISALIYNIICLCVCLLLTRTHSYTLTKWLKCAPKYCIRWNCNVQRSSKCGAFPWRLN